MLDRMGRHPNRPGHMHMKVSAPGHREVTTHLFVKDSPYLDSDAVFGVRDSLIVEFERCPAGTAMDGRKMDQALSRGALRLPPDSGKRLSAP